MPRPEGSGRPSKNRRLISVFVSEAGIAAVKQAADKLGLSQAEVYRRAFAAGLPLVEKSNPQPVAPEGDVVTGSGPDEPDPINEVA